MHRTSAYLTLALALVGSLPASAHLSYPASRNFGTYNGFEPRTFTISGQTTKAFGWADGTDADFARQDDQRYLQFTLENTATITITITAVDPATLLPAFSIYAGLGHAATDSTNPDYDRADVTVQYLASLGDPQPREGAFDALHTFKIGNDSKPGYVAELATLTYMGNAADGTAANYGSAAGINGDGVADGVVSATFVLGPGAYTMAVGGANYASTDTTNRTFDATVTSVPEPSSTLLFVSAAALLGTSRRCGRGNTAGRVSAPKRS